MKLAHSALLVADYLLAHRTRHFTPVHILVLTYICHGWTLALKNRPLIEDEVEAWEYGPVIRVLYNMFSKYGGDAITRLSACNTDILDSDAVGAWKSSVGKELDEVRDVLDAVLDKYGKLTAEDLLRLMHRSDSPWIQCYDKRYEDSTIPDYITKEYYRALAAGRIK